MREEDRDAFLSLMRKKGCLIAGLDYYAFTRTTPFVFPRVFSNYNERVYNGGVVYIRICMKDSAFVYSVIGSSHEGGGR